MLGTSQVNCIVTTLQMSACCDIHIITPELLFIVHHDTAMQNRIITSGLSNTQLSTAAGHGLNIEPYNGERNSAMSPLYLARAATSQPAFP